LNITRPLCKLAFPQKKSSQKTKGNKRFMSSQTYKIFLVLCSMNLKRTLFAKLYVLRHASFTLVLGVFSWNISKFVRKSLFNISFQFDIGSEDSTVKVLFVLQRAFSKFILRERSHQMLLLSPATAAAATVRRLAVQKRALISAAVSAAGGGGDRGGDGRSCRSHHTFSHPAFAAGPGKKFQGRKLFRYGGGLLNQQRIGANWSCKNACL